MARYLPSGIHHSFATPATGTIQGLTDEVTAFVGRTLRGPVGRPVRVRSFDEFTREFGGLWTHSTLSYSVYQYFLNGGETALIVRVCRAARSATLELPADNGALVIEAVDPGRHEVLRAAVDYDGLERDDHSRFNLTVQRVRGFNSEAVLAQEIFAGVSVDSGDPSYIGTCLRRSRLVTLLATPPQRPRKTLTLRGREPQLYCFVNLDGDDGAPPEDADLLGGSTRRDGLFALTGEYYFSQLYLPPPDFGLDVGAPVLRAAARICTRRDVLLLCDTPREWRSVTDAEHGMQRFSLRSSNAALYFPRYWMTEPDGGSRLVSPGGAVAGILARISRESGMGAAPAGHGVAARGVKSLAVQPGEQDCYRLGRLGVNCMRVGRGGRRILWDARTLVDEGDASAAWQSLRVRRIALYIKRSVRHGLRWIAGEDNVADLWTRIVGDVNAFLHDEFVRGLFRGGTPASAYAVRCDHSTNPASARKAGIVGMEIDFAPLSPGQFLTLRLQVSVVPAADASH